jgi:enolase
MVTLEDESKGWSAVPSGASTGKYEARELRDDDPKRYKGMGVLKAVANINNIIAPALIGIDAADQEKIDQTMIQIDGTENKSNLGANAILAVSLATAKAQAASEKKELYLYLSKFNPENKGVYTMPIPEMNVINGGRHANWATDIQEYMLLPVGANSIAEAIRMNAEIYQILKTVIKQKGYTVTVGDEGGFAPNVVSNEEPFQLLAEAIEKANYRLGEDIVFGIDSAASELYEDGKYHLKKENKVVTSPELMSIYKELKNKYPIVSIEDAFAEDDWEAFQKMTGEIGHTTQIVGDDLYVTNVKRIQQGIELKATNAVLIKLNQIGTLTETIAATLLAKKHGLQAIISHRSGETEDTFIADFVSAMGTGQIKTGAPARSERVAKYNRLMRIERQLGEQAMYFTFPWQASKK